MHLLASRFRERDRVERVTIIMSASFRIVLLFALISLPVLAWGGEIDDIEARNAMGRIDGFADLLDRGTEDSVRALFKLGNAYYEVGMLNEAVASYRRALVPAVDRKVIMNLTMVLTENDRREEADLTYRNALERAPKDPILHSYYGDFLVSDADSSAGIPAAIEHYRRALDLDEKCVEAHFGMGVLFARMGIYKEALREWERVSEITSTHRLTLQTRKNIDKVKREHAH